MFISLDIILYNICEQMEGYSYIKTESVRAYRNLPDTSELVYLIVLRLSTELVPPSIVLLFSKLYFWCDNT